MNHTNERIKKLADKGLSNESTARKIERPGDLERVRRILELEKMLQKRLQPPEGMTDKEE